MRYYAAMSHVRKIEDLDELKSIAEHDKRTEVRNAAQMRLRAIAKQGAQKDGN